MKYFLSICLVFISILLASAQDTNLSALKSVTKQAVQQEIKNHYKVNCPDYSTSTLVKFYTSELKFFAIEKAFQAIEEWRENKKIGKKDIIYLSLYYPIVGFDPETGYNTDIILKRKFRKNYHKEFSVEEKEFKNKKYQPRSLKWRLKTKSECYGTGYLFLFKFDKNLKLVDTKAALSIGFD